MYKNIIAVISLCSISTITGFNKTVGGYVAKDFHGTVKETTKISFKTGSIGILVLLIFAIRSYYYNQNLTEGILFIIAALVFLPYSILPRYQSVLAGLEKFKEIFILNLSSKTALFLVAVAVVLYFDKGILWYGSSQLLISTLFFILFYIYSTKNLNNTKVDSGFLKHSMTLSIINIGTQIISPGLMVYINYTLGSTELALFAIGNKIPSQLSGMVKPIMHPIGIRLAKRDKIDYNRVVIKFIPLTLVLGFFLYFILYMAIEVFGHYIINETYAVSLDYAKLLGLLIILSPTFAILNSNVVWEKNNKGYGVSLYVNQALTIIGYFLFLEKYGVYSIAFTNFAALFIQILIMIFYIFQDTKNAEIINKR